MCPAVREAELLVRCICKKRIGLKKTERVKGFVTTAASPISATSQGGMCGKPPYQLGKRKGNSMLMKSTRLINIRHCRHENSREMVQKKVEE